MFIRKPDVEIFFFLWTVFFFFFKFGGTNTKFENTTFLDVQEHKIISGKVSRGKAKGTGCQRRVRVCCDLNTRERLMAVGQRLSTKDGPQRERPCWGRDTATP